MAKSINQVILMGRLTRDPEQRTTSTGKTIASFSIAVDRGGESDAADFFEVTAWEKLGDLVIQYLAKGRRVLVQGRLRQDSWDDKETGKKRSKLSLTVDRFHFVPDGKKTQSPQTTTQPTETPTTPANTTPPSEDDQPPF
jgi:single-strand DNA-binding protein